MTTLGQFVLDNMQACQESCSEQVFQIRAFFCKALAAYYDFEIGLLSGEISTPSQHEDARMNYFFFQLEHSDAISHLGDEHVALGTECSCSVYRGSEQSLLLEKEQLEALYCVMLNYPNIEI